MTPTVKNVCPFHLACDGQRCILYLFLFFYPQGVSKKAGAAMHPHGATCECDPHLFLKIVPICSCVCALLATCA